MRTFISIIFIMFSILIMSSIKKAQSIQVNATLSFTDVVDNLDLTKHTSLAVKNYWKDIKGAEVTWKGTVQNVKGGKGKAQILVANKERKTYKGYNIVLVTYNLEAAAKLEPGQPINFTGILYDYKGRKGNPIIIYLNEAVLNNKTK